MGLDAAIYEPATGKIFGVRGQWLFQFNATTGHYEQSLRFCDDSASPTSLTVISGTLYIATWNIPNVDFHTSHPSPPGDIYIVNALTFAITGQFNFQTVLGAGWSMYGFRSINTNGTRLMFAGFNQADPLVQTVFSVNPSNIPGYTYANSGGWINDSAYDSVNDLFWAPDTRYPLFYAFNNDVSNWSWDTGLIHTPTGVTHNVAQAKVYCVCGNRYLLRATALDALPMAWGPKFVVTNLDTGLATINPFRLKSVNNLPGNPYNGNLLIPTWKTNQVLVWNPASDLAADMVIKTGFTAPIDIVNTPTKSFAVQTGLVGLKEIT